MPFFRVKAGAHAGPGRSSRDSIANKGDIVESENDLIAMFGKEKFEVVPDAEAKKSLKAKRQAKTELPKDVEMPDRENPVDPGEMAEPDLPGPTTPSKREKLLEDTAPLRQDDPNVKTTADQALKAKGQKTLAKAQAAEDDDAEDDEDYGDDLTEDFDGAEDGGVFIYKKGKTYTVYDAETDEVLNDEELTNKTQVKQFLKDYLGEDEE